MYKSAKMYMHVPYIHKPLKAMSATGVKQYDGQINGLCYAEGKVEVVKNNLGQEVVSSLRLYVDGTSTIKYTDTIVIDGRESSIVAISTFYDKHGKADLKVIYL